MGRHEAGGVPRLQSEIRQLIFDLNTEITTLTQVKHDVRTIGSKILMLQSREQGVMISGGALLNNCPDAIDEMIRGLQIHIRTLEEFINHIL